MFGVEHDIDILFSPTHLGLGAAMIVILTTPVRAAAADPGCRSRPACGGCCRQCWRPRSRRSWCLPLLALARRWAFPFGAVTIVYTVVGAFCAAITGLADPAMILWLPFTGLLLDAIARWLLGPRPARPARLLAFAGLAPLVTWTVYLAVALTTTRSVVLTPELGGGRPEPVVELYPGMPVVQALLGVVVAAALVPRGGRALSPGQPSDRS